MMKLAARYLLILFAAFLAPGCSTVDLVAPLALPAATCALLKKEPASAGYVRAVRDALTRFASGPDLSADSLRNALVAVPLDGVSPAQASAIYAGVVLAYKVTAERYATRPDRDAALRTSLQALAAGLDAGLAQCAPAATRAFGERATRAAADELAAALENELRR